MLGLSEMQLSWPVVGWIFRLFSGILERLSKEQNGRPLERLEPPMGPTNLQSGNITADSTAQRSSRQIGSVLHCQSNLGTLQQFVPSSSSPVEYTDNQLIFQYDDFGPDIFDQLSGLWEMPKHASASSRWNNQLS
jgi:hypothetical protein